MIKKKGLPVGAGPGLGQVERGGEGVDGDIGQYLTACCGVGSAGGRGLEKQHLRLRDMGKKLLRTRRGAAPGNIGDTDNLCQGDTLLLI